MQLLQTCSVRLSRSVFFVELLLLLLFESLAETWRKMLHCISWPVQEMSGDLRMHLFIFQLKTPWKCWTNTDPSLAPLLHYLKCSVKWTHSFLQFTQSLAAPELLPSTRGISDTWTLLPQTTDSEILLTLTANSFECHYYECFRHNKMFTELFHCNVFFKTYRTIAWIAKNSDFKL